MLSLRKAYEKLRHRYVNDPRTRKLTGYEVLILISASDPKSPKVFADLLSCKPAQITGYVSRLESLGLLKRKISQADKRSFTFQLTKLGKNSAEDLLIVTEDIYRANTSLTEKENIELVRLLDKM